MFKKCFFGVLILATGPGRAAAQFQEGDRMIGATVATVVYNSGSSDISVDQIGNSRSTIKNYNFNISPSMGWFLSEKTVVGGTVAINPAGNKITYEQNGSTFQSDKTNTFNIGLGGFVRHYLGHSGKMYPFGQFGFNLGISSLKTEGFLYKGSSPNVIKTTYEGSSSGGFFANAGLQLGLTKMMGDNAGLDLAIGYTYGYSKHVFDKTTQVDNGNDGSIEENLENETTTKFTNHGFFLGVGFQIFLRKKK